MSEKKSVLRDKSFGFAVDCIILNQELTESRKEFVISKQFLRSGTSIGANIREAQNAESKADFIHKLGIAQKECDETIYWLELLNRTGYINDQEFESISVKANELLKMIGSSVLSSKSHSNS